MIKKIISKLAKIFVATLSLISYSCSLLIIYEIIRLLWNNELSVRATMGALAFLLTIIMGYIKIYTLQKQIKDNQINKLQKIFRKAQNVQKNRNK